MLLNLSIQLSGSVMKISAPSVKTRMVNRLHGGPTRIGGVWWTVGLTKVGRYAPMTNDHERDGQLRRARETALEQELEKQKKQYETQLQQQQQLQQQLQQKFNEELKRQLLLPSHDVAVEEKEVEKATDLMKKFDDLYKSARKFAFYDSRDLGMSADTELLPDKTSQGGYVEIQKNIETKTKELQKKWKRIVTGVYKMRVMYTDIQSLRHRRIRYKKKHSKAVKTKAKKKKAMEDARKEDDALVPDIQDMEDDERTNFQ